MIVIIIIIIKLNVINVFQCVSINEFVNSLDFEDTFRFSPKSKNIVKMKLKEIISISDNLQIPVCLRLHNELKFFKNFQKLHLEKCEKSDI